LETPERISLSSSSGGRPSEPGEGDGKGLTSTTSANWRTRVISPGGMGRPDGEGEREGEGEGDPAGEAEGGRVPKVGEGEVERELDADGNGVRD